MKSFETQDVKIDDNVTSHPAWESKKAFSGEALEAGDTESVYIFQSIYGMSDENLSEITHDENMQEKPENAEVIKLHNNMGFVSVGENVQRSLSGVEDNESYFHDQEAARKAYDREMEQRKDDLYEVAQSGDDYMELYQNVNVDSSKNYHIDSSLLLVDYVDEAQVEQQAQAHDIINLAAATEPESIDDLWVGEELILDSSQATISPKSASANDHSMFTYDVGMGGENHVTDIILDSAYLGL